MYGSAIHRLTRKVSTREIRRQAQRAINAGTQATLVLLACIAQKGGEIVITQGTLDQCQREIGNLDFEIVDGVAPGEFVVRMLTGSIGRSAKEAA